MFLVHARDLKKDGTHPVFLYGYGGFEASIQPFYKSGLNTLLSPPLLVPSDTCLNSLFGSSTKKKKNLFYFLCVGSVAYLLFVRHLGGILAVANIRGGGEYGLTWHKGGQGTEAGQPGAHCRHIFSRLTPPCAALQEAHRGTSRTALTTSSAPLSI